MMPISLDEVRGWDAADPLAAHRDAFDLPQGLVYLDGNSLGPLSHAARDRIARLVGLEWGRGLIGSWDGAGWMAAPGRTGDLIAPIIGASPGEVTVGDSTSVNLFKLAAAAVMLRPGRPTLLTEEGNFPTDRHVLDGLARLRPDLRVRAVPAGELEAALDQEVALLLLCHVHYRTGARHDMARLTQAARRAGALTVWDLSHSAGAIPVALNADGAELATGCGYKFLNGGPGAPAFLYVAGGLQAQAGSPLQGWIGHAEPFGFSDRYQPAPGIARFLSGTPGMLGLAALEAGVEVFRAADPAALWSKSARLFDLFASLAEAWCPSLRLLTPRDAGLRGSHIAFVCDDAERLMRAFAGHGVIGDFRPPDIIRFGLTPLYTRYQDIWVAAEALRVALAARARAPIDRPPRDGSAR
jgi:kynureninase